MVIFQYLKVMIKILIAKYRGYTNIRLYQVLYPRVKRKIENKGYTVTEEQETLITHEYTIIDWSVYVC